MSWKKMELSPLQNARMAWSWSVTMHLSEKEQHKFQKEYEKELKKDQELHPEDHFTIDERIAKLEKYTKSPAGTMLTRTLAPEAGVGWTFALGQMEMPKRFFYGNTINEVIMEAEKAMRKK